MRKRSRPGRPATAISATPRGSRALTLPQVVAIIAFVTLAAAFLFLVQERRIAGEWGYALDDSWIYATMARNLATGHGFAFNANEPVAGATGPLYTFILAFFYLLFHEVIWSAKIFGILCHMGAGVAIYSGAAAPIPWPPAGPPSA
jgi:hypothetical protein